MDELVLPLFLALTGTAVIYYAYAASLRWLAGLRPSPWEFSRPYLVSSALGLLAVVTFVLATLAIPLIGALVLVPYMVIAGVAIVMAVRTGRYEKDQLEKPEHREVLEQRLAVLRSRRGKALIALAVLAAIAWWGWGAWTVADVLR